MTEENLKPIAPQENNNAAPLSKRIVAMVIDFLLVSFFAGFWLDEKKAVEIQNLVMEHHWQVPPEYTEQVLHFQFEVLVAFVATFFILNGFLLLSRAQTIGKALMKIAVRDLEDRKPGVVQLFLGRYLIQVVMLSVPPLNIVDIILILVRSDRRSLHDLFARTKVVDLKIPVAQQNPNTFTA